MTPASIKPELVQFLEEHAGPPGKAQLAVHLVGRNYPLVSQDSLRVLLGKNWIRPDTPVFHKERGRWFEAARFPELSEKKVGDGAEGSSSESGQGKNQGELVLAAKLGHEAEEAASGKEYARAIEIYQEVVRLNPRYPLVKKRIRQLKKMLGEEGGASNSTPSPKSNPEPTRALKGQPGPGNLPPIPSPPPRPSAKLPPIPTPPPRSLPLEQVPPARQLAPPHRSSTPPPMASSLPSRPVGPGGVKKPASFDNFDDEKTVMATSESKPAPRRKPSRADWGVDEETNAEKAHDERTAYLGPEDLLEEIDEEGAQNADIHPLDEEQVFEEEIEDEHIIEEFEQRLADQAQRNASEKQALPPPGRPTPVPTPKRPAQVVDDSPEQTDPGISASGEHALAEHALQSKQLEPLMEDLEFALGEPVDEPTANEKVIDDDDLLGELLDPDEEDAADVHLGGDQTLMNSLRKRHLEPFDGDDSTISTSIEEVEAEQAMFSDDELSGGGAPQEPGHFPLGVSGSYGGMGKPLPPINASLHPVSSYIPEVGEEVGSSVVEREEHTLMASAPVAPMTDEAGEHTLSGRSTGVRSAGAASVNSERPREELEEEGTIEREPLPIPPGFLPLGAPPPKVRTDKQIELPGRAEEHRELHTIGLSALVEEVCLSGRWFASVKEGGGDLVVRDLLSEHKPRVRQLKYRCNGLLVERNRLLLLHTAQRMVSFWSLPDLIENGTVIVGEQPSDFAILPDGRVLVTNLKSGSLSLITTRPDGYAHCEIPIGGTPFRIVRGDGRFLILHQKDLSLTFWDHSLAKVPTS